MFNLTRPGDQHWLKISWLRNYQPDLAILKHEILSNLAYLRKKWPFLVLDNWKLVTNFLVKVVTQVLLFSGITAFNSFSADFELMLMPRSVPTSQVLMYWNIKHCTNSFTKYEQIWTLNFWDCLIYLSQSKHNRKSTIQGSLVCNYLLTYHSLNVGTIFNLEQKF